MNDSMMYGPEFFIVYGAALLITVACLCDAKKRREIFRPQVPWWKQGLAGIALGLAFLLAVGGVNLLVSSGFSPFQFVLLPPLQMANLLAFQLLVAVTEEALFRGYLTALGRQFRWHWAAIACVSAALFGAGHWIFHRDWTQLVFSAVLGFVFSVAYQKSRYCTIYSLMLAHFLYDLAIVNVPA